jgi:pimeloyl-ACP methyl ester carboxylesterase
MLRWFLVLALIAGTARAEVHTLRVPLDYAQPAAGSAELAYDLGAPFDAAKPTVIVVADGQQFFVRDGAMAKLQHDLFGPNVNVVGIVTRGTTPAFVAAALDAHHRVDWRKAWRVFQADQWIGDIESVRRAVAGDRPIMLYGRSGGAYLVHQYLAVHGDHVTRAFTQSPVNATIARDLGIRLDRFWDELSPEQQHALQAALAQRPKDRTAMLLALQRQHFYVTADQLAAERARLIHALATGDDATFAAMRKTYEVDSILELMRSSDAIPQIVRVLELIGPSGEFDTAKTGVSPLIEPQRAYTSGLRALGITAAGFDVAAPHHVATEVFVLAARQDEAVDYRTAIALAYSYSHHELFIVDDNHTFAKLSGAGKDATLVQAFFEAGLGSPRLARALRDAAPFQWRD